MTSKYIYFLKSAIGWCYNRKCFVVWGGFSERNRIWQRLVLHAMLTKASKKIVILISFYISCNHYFKWHAFSQLANTNISGNSYCVWLDHNMKQEPIDYPEKVFKIIPSSCSVWKCQKVYLSINSSWNYENIPLYGECLYWNPCV